jgi:hypothetical protein
VGAPTQKNENKTCMEVVMGGEGGGGGLLLRVRQMPHSVRSESLILF